MARASNGSVDRNEVTNLRRIGPDCICDGKVPFCAPCLMRWAIHLRIQHPDSLSVSILKRRIPGLKGREASLLLEASKLIR